METAIVAERLSLLSFFLNFLRGMETGNAEAHAVHGAGLPKLP